MSHQLPKVSLAPSALLTLAQLHERLATCPATRSKAATRLAEGQTPLVLAVAQALARATTLTSHRVLGALLAAGTARTRPAHTRGSVSNRATLAPTTPAAEAAAARLGLNVIADIITANPEAVARDGEPPSRRDAARLARRRWSGVQEPGCLF